MVSSTIVHRSCLSRGLERVIRAVLCGQCRIYARWQGTNFWPILYRTTYVPLFNYNTHWRTFRIQSTLSPPQIPTYPSPPHSQPSSSPSSSPLVHAIQIQNKDLGIWVEAYINAHSGAFVDFTDFMIRLTVGFSRSWRRHRLKGLTLVNAQNVMASSLGWHNDGSGNSTNTA